LSHADIRHSEDRALVRRYKFLGFPGEKRGTALSYSELERHMGADKAASLITQIGVLAQSYRLDQYGIPLSEAVARIVGSLTHDELQSYAKGNIVPPRVEAMLGAEVETAKIQQKQPGGRQENGKPDPSMAQPLSGFGTAAFAAWRGFSGQGDGGNSRSAAPSSAAYGQNMGSTTDTAFLHAVGISGGTALALGQLGFKTREQVRQVVDDTRSLHLAPDKGAVVDVARLKKNSGERFEAHKHSLQEYGDELRAAKHEREEALKEADPAKQAERLRHAEEMRQTAEQKQDHYRDHNTQTKQERGSYDPVRTRVRKSVETHDDMRSKLENEVGVEGARNLTTKRVDARLKPKAQQKLQQTAVQAREQIEERPVKPVTVARRNQWSDDDDVADNAPSTPGKSPGEKRVAVSAPSPTTSPDAPKAVAPRESDKQAEPNRQVASNEPPKNDKGEKGKAPAKQPEKPVVQARLNAPSGPTAA
jgi:hypothetical protein